jgi:membrane-associated HD superfamily phosphohydrolase
MNIPKISIRLFVITICAFLMFGAAFGQTKKKKKHTARKPVAARPVTQTGDASVVSRADQYQDSSAQIIQPITPSLADTQGLPDDTAKRIKDLQARIKKLESTQASDKKSTYEQRQQVLLTNLDILTKSEQRAESLRKQRFEMIDKESSIRTRLDQLEVDIRPESIERSVATVGTLRPEELREAKRKSLEAEQKNLQNLLNDVVAARTKIEADILRSDALTEKLRTRLEKDIDDALDSDEPDQ